MAEFEVEIVLEGPDFQSEKPVAAVAKKSDPQLLDQLRVQLQPISGNNHDVAAQKLSNEAVDGGGTGNRTERTRSFRLPFLRELKKSRRLSYIKDLENDNKRSSERSSTDYTESIEMFQSPTPMDEEEGRDLGTYKVGHLIKTSQTRGETSIPGNSRQRKFRLTHDSLEYLQNFSHVKVKRSYPMTAIEKVDYDEATNPVTFKLIFSTYIMTLQAETKEEARDWVQKINEVWSLWTTNTEDDLEELASDEVATEEFSISMRPPSPTSSPKKSVYITNAHRFRSNSGPSYLRRESSTDINQGTYDARKHRAFRIPRLRPPSLERTDHRLVHNPTINYDPAQDHLHGEFTMIKYPKKILHLPAERLFTIDNHNLQVLWKTRSSDYRLKSSLGIRRIVEIRKGQETPSFDKFPYEQVEEQSFSFIFESESNKYAKLDSLDVICDRMDHFNLWMEGLKTLVVSNQWLYLYPQRYENSDPTILWLKQIWTCKSANHELKQQDAISLTKKFMGPDFNSLDAKTAVKRAHMHQFKHTFNYGAALRWDGFVLLFYLLCDKTNLQLYSIFQEYATEHPDLGLTENEFRRFLIKECHWLPSDTKRSVLSSLMKSHDAEHHQAIKKFCANNNPREYQLMSKLLTFAGFLSFLRSRDNSVINLEHETVYQDMTQPLSHYYINSSHNTYLEGDQLRGTSSTDAYVRALLQGCRCVEIDCWDDVLNANGLSSKEPVVYHGYTFTTKVPFRNVIHTINDYGFSTSLYPIIISIENHCSSSQQSKMAKIFRAIIGERLPSCNVVEVEGRERLPSPQELQGKVILKGSYGNNKDKKDRKGKKIRSTSQPLLTAVESSLPLKTSPPISASNGINGIDGIEEPIDRLKHQLRRSVRLRELQGRIQQQEQGQDDQELSFTETAKDLQDLIVYCRSVSIKPWNWKKQKDTAVSEMFSFGEPTAIELCKKFPRDVLSCTEKQLVRTYPKGTRFDSSNYDPMQMWNCGIQMVALNFQYPEIEMHLNQGFFRLNGGCGYVLKPLLLRREDPGGTGGVDKDSRPGGKAPYTPDMMVPHPHVTPLNLEIELLSGQRLSPWNKKCNFLTVDIHTYGIQHDNAVMKQATHTRPFWPSWEKGKHVLKHQILMPELCLVYFRVENESRKIYGQNCFHLISLQPGLKFVPLRTNGGELIPESGLFVRIKIEENSETHLPQIPEETSHQPNVTMSLTSKTEYEKNGKIVSLMSPRRTTSPPVLQKFKDSGQSQSVDLPKSDNSVVVKVDVHVDEGTAEVTRSETDEDERKCGDPEVARSGTDEDGRNIEDQEEEESDYYLQVITVDN